LLLFVIILPYPAGNWLWWVGINDASLLTAMIKSA